MEEMGRKASSDAKTEDGNERKASKVARDGPGGDDLDSGAGQTGISVLTKMIHEEGERIA